MAGHTPRSGSEFAGKIVLPVAAGVLYRSVGQGFGPGFLLVALVADPRAAAAPSPHALEPGAAPFSCGVASAVLKGSIRR